jgi:hypothetical protein
MLGMIVHTCNPSNWEVEAEEDYKFQASMSYITRHISIKGGGREARYRYMLF